MLDFTELGKMEESIQRSFCYRYFHYLLVNVFNYAAK